MTIDKELQDRINAASTSVDEDAETDLSTVERANPTVQAGAGAVFALRIPTHLLEQVRAKAADRGIGTSTLIREWILEQLESSTDEPEDLATAVDRLARDVEQVRRLTHAT